MKDDLLALIRADAGVAAEAGARIWWTERPQGSALPAATMHVVGGRDEYHLQGRLGGVETRVQVDCWAETYLAADGLAQALRALLSGYRRTVGATVFLGIFLDAIRDLTDVGGLSDPRLFRISLDFKVNSTGA